MSPRRVVAFRAGALSGAAPADQVERVLAVPALLPAPAAPAWVLGLVTRGGETRAVVDVVRRLLGTEPPEPPRHLLWGTWKGIPAALAVTEVEGVLPVEEEAAAVPEGLPAPLRSYLLGAVRAGGSTRVLLDVDALLGRDADVLSAAAASEPSGES
ncbi:hypothetical protein FBQ97_00610 [Acidobacteria bacterium ACD]|nr:MAG: hypothetical protein EDX89_05740 [Acidobacteriota bacterium]MDL1948305.1 hypothetical protein [Acidobacteria bacterium ACD]